VATATKYTLSELADQANVSTRTVRYYIQHDLLPPPSGAGPGAHYDDGHLDRLRLIKRLKKSHLPLAEIRKQIEPLSNEDVQAVLVEESDEVTDTAIEYVRGILNVREEALRELPRSPQYFEFRDRSISPAPPKILEPTRAQWERIGLSPDIEVHVRRPLSYQQNKAVNRILEAAREILKEETR
jgi:DNA-binding transcriptional MerR regulator